MTRYAVVLSGPRLRRILHATDFALRAVVKAAAHRHDMRVTGFLDGFGGLLADQAPASGLRRPSAHHRGVPPSGDGGRGDEHVLMADTLGKPRRVDPQGERVIAARGIGTIFGDGVRS